MSKDDDVLKELRQIRKLIEAQQEEEAGAPKSIWEDFVEFVKEYKVIGFAVAFILGIYITKTVQVLVNDLIMLITTMAMPEGIQWETSNLAFSELVTSLEH